MKILVIESTFSCAFYFRRQLIFRLSSENDVTLIVDKDEGGYFAAVPNLKVIELPSNLKAVGLFSNLRLLFRYKKVIKAIQPDLILSFTIKPNLYASFVKPKNVFLATNITGLGQSFGKKGFLNFLVVRLYRAAFKKCDFVFWQNEGIHDVFLRCKIPVHDGTLIPGSGVDLDYFRFYPINDRPGDQRVFLFSARLIKEKGIEEYLAAAVRVKKQFPKVIFMVAGNIFGEYKKQIDDLSTEGIISYVGFVKDLRDLYKKADCIVLPSFYKEGISNVLLESLATGRPIISTTDIDGCKELVSEGQTGFGVRSRSVGDLEKAMKKFLSVSHDELITLSIASRKFVEQGYDRNIVIRKYLDLVHNLERNSK